MEQRRSIYHGGRLSKHTFFDVFSKGSTGSWCNLNSNRRPCPIVPAAFALMSVSDRRYERDEAHWTTLEIETPKEVSRPLVVDLDGTLIASDLLIETAFSELGRRPQSIVDMLMALSRGKAALKHRLSEPVDFDPGTLPYDPEVLSLIRQAKAAGRPVYLASASHQRLVRSIADHLGLFTGWFASDETTNLAGRRKAQQLVEAFGERGFDYVGNDAADLPVWEKAAKSIAIRTPAGVRKRLARQCPEAEHLNHTRPTWRTWAKMLRVHQYAKNALIFLPLLAAHLFTLGGCHPGHSGLHCLLALRFEHLHSQRSGRPAGRPRAIAASASGPCRAVPFP